MEARALKFAWWLRSLVALVAVFLPLGHPHVWRQVDTLGVSLRYWLRWTVESPTPWPLLPAVLHSGDSLGVMPMEWPFLNMLAAPLFLFGPETGTALARALVFALNLGLVLWNCLIWKDIAPAGISARRSFRWMPLIGLGLVFFPKFIPDATAMLLVLAGTGFLVQRQKSGLAAVLLLIGFLMKPTSVIVLALLWLAPELIATLRFAAPAVILPVIGTGVYYVWGTQWMQDLNLAGGESLYRVAPQHPWVSLRSFFSEGRELWDLFFQGLGFYAGLPLLLLLSGWLGFKKRASLWLLLLLQIVAIAVLDGTHSFKHRYYFMGTLPVICLILQGVLDELAASPAARRMRAVLLVLIGGTALTALAYEWRPLYIPTPAERFLSFRACSHLKSQLPGWPWNQAFVFRTQPRAYPLVGLCFGERVGSERAAFGLYVDGDPLPSACRVVARSGSVVGAECL